MKFRQTLMMLVAVIALVQLAGAQSNTTSSKDDKQDQPLRLKADLIQLRAIVGADHRRRD